MRIKIIGDNNCARATRHLLRMANFAVSEYLPVEAITHAPHAGFAITIELAPAPHTPNPCLLPDEATHDQPATTDGEASPLFSGASSASPSEHIHFDSMESALEAAILRHVSQLAGAPVVVDRPGGVVHSERELRIVVPVSGDAEMDESSAVAVEFGVLRGLLDLTSPAFGNNSENGAVNYKENRRVPLSGSSSSGISTSGIPVIAPRGARAFMEQFMNGAQSGDTEQTSRDAAGQQARAASDGTGVVGELAVVPGTSGKAGRKKKWWTLGAIVLSVLALSAGAAASPRRATTERARSEKVRRTDRIYLDWNAGLDGPRLSLAPLARKVAIQGNAMSAVAIRRVAIRGVDNSRVYVHPAMAAAAEPQGQFLSGQFADPCKEEMKSFVSINQTATTQLAGGTTGRKIYICSIHVVVATATNVALVEGTGSVCATGTAGVSGFGGATAATGWNFAANGGIVLGTGDASVGVEVTSADNLCLFNSGSGQVSGGISYVVQ